MLSGAYSFDVSISFMILTKRDPATSERSVLSDRDGEMNFNLPGPEAGNWGTGSLVHPQKGATLRVRSTTLDCYCDEQKIQRLDLLKIDVEGAEALVLRGAVKTLSTLRPRILFEKNADSLSECQRILEDFGYRLSDLRGRPFRESMVSDPHCPDLLATPR